MGVAAARDRSPGRSLVSRGLRPYEDADSDTFLELVPGPRGRDGLPECIGFWKRRIEAGSDAEAFPVGVIYGPTGSGKSSLVRAGLIRAGRLGLLRLRRVDDRGDRTAPARRLAQLVSGSRAPPGCGRVSQGAAAGRKPSGPPKVLIVPDQFEQWLFGQRSAGRGALNALRQCDGERTQALLLVGDDFWTDLTRFFRNLFEDPPDWMAGTRPRSTSSTSNTRGRFCDLAGAGAWRAAADPAAFFPGYPEFSIGPSRPCRRTAGLFAYALFCWHRNCSQIQALTPRPWPSWAGPGPYPAPRSSTRHSPLPAPPQNRLHRRAAQAVLRRLLPEGGVLIKGHVSSRQAPGRVRLFGPTP